MTDEYRVDKNFERIKRSENNIILFGEVGTGKSALCNTLVGSDGSAFVESEKTESQTLETIGKKQLNNGVEWLIEQVNREDSNSKD